MNTINQYEKGLDKFNPMSDEELITEYNMVFEDKEATKELRDDERDRMVHKLADNYVETKLDEETDRGIMEDLGK